MEWQQLNATYALAGASNIHDTLNSFKANGSFVWDHTYSAGLGAPNTIIVSEATRNLLGGLFELEPMGNHELKGFARPVPVWRILGEAAAKSRFAATRGGELPLVGRGQEMELMLDRWRLARAGEGQIVTVLGEAGIGKSRSVEALYEVVSGEPHTRIDLQCSPYHRDSALYPVIQHLGRAARFDRHGRHPDRALRQARCSGPSGRWPRSRVRPREGDGAGGMMSLSPLRRDAGAVE